MNRRNFLKALYGVSVCAVVPALISKPDIPARSVAGFVNVEEYQSMTGIPHEIGRYEAFTYYLGGDVVAVKMEFTNGRPNIKKIRFNEYYKFPPKITRYKMG